MPIRFMIPLLLASRLLSAVTFTITPEVIYDCVNGLGHATLSWSDTGATADIRVGSPTGPSLTGFVSTSGTAATGDWIDDGLSFYLISSRGTEASVTAHLRCGGTPSTLEEGLKNGSYFPLQAGNTWVYRTDSRFSTSDYITNYITGTEVINGQTYYLYSSSTLSADPAYLRADNDQRIWSYNKATGREILILDPARTQPAAYSGPLGGFPGAVSFTVLGSESLGFADSVFVRGVGLVKSTANMTSGSSGGFVFGSELVEARLSGGVHLVVPAPRLSLTSESAVLDLTNKKVTNCAVPRYCVACSSDPPGTYKPCSQTRIEGNAPSSYFLELDLLDSRNRIIFSAKPISGAAGDLVQYIQVPLYSEPNQPISPGDYKLVGRLKSSGQEFATASLNLRIN